MALVVFSERLRRDVVNSLSKVYEGEIVAAQEQPKHWSSLVYAAMFPADVLAKMRALPVDYWQTKNSLHVDGIAVDGRHGPPVNLDFAPSVLWPAKLDLSVNGATSATYYNRITIDVEDSRWATFLEEYKTWARNIREVQKRREEAMKSMEAFLSQYRTLSPALKDMPALWELLPKNTKERHLQKVETKKRERNKVDVDHITRRVAGKLLLDGKL